MLRGLLHRLAAPLFGAALLGSALFSPALAQQGAASAAPAARSSDHQAYEAKLADDLATAADLCARVPCKDVFPGATRFSERKGQPPYVEAYGVPEGGGAEKLLGYVMLSTDITDTPAYSGKPVVTLIGMDTAGKYVGIKVLKHSEPILLLGIPESALIGFNNQYLGRSVKDKIEVGPSHPEENIIGVDAISGATVTVIAQNQVISTSAATTARQVGILEPTARKPAQFVDSGASYSWDQLVSMGAVQRLVVRSEQVGLPRGPEPFIELWFGDVMAPSVGKSLLGEANWKALQDGLKDGDHALFIIRTAGHESFKGSGFVRGGIYDRVQVKQGSDAFTFRDTDYQNLYGLKAAGAPTFTESALFIVRSKSFSSAYPWRLSFLGNRVDKETGQRSFANFDGKYWMPAELLQGGRPEVKEDAAPWKRAWTLRVPQLIVFSLLLIMVGVAYAFREKLTRRSTHKNKWPVNSFKYVAWTLSIFFVGFYLLAQPSITQVLTWFHSLLFQWQWSLFLSDPFIFLFWIFIGVTVFLFGRGLFCGWMCPFGSLSEALYKIAEHTPLKRWQRHPSFALHNRLKWVKYAIFFGLLVVSMIDMGLAEKLAEVEPFKTTFLVGIQNRPWPYGLYVVALLGLAIFIERPFCKYLCPLGAALAMPSTFRFWGLKRKQDCNTCHACQKGCGSLAIDNDGRIDHRECLHCLDCMILYTDEKSCPPLAKERKRRERDGLVITPIGENGYYIPLTPVPVNMAYHAPMPTDQMVSAKVVAGPDPRLASPPVPAPHHAKPGLAWLWAETKLHLWPWSREGWQTHRALYVGGFVLAASATAMWLLAAGGKLTPHVVISWWFGWSVYEVFIRMQGRRYVKDGPWWQNHFRLANWMDMLSYVGFKNLLIGAAFFMALTAFGLLPAL